MPGVILLNPSKPKVRQRYSIAHEIGHTLFPDYQAEVRQAGTLYRLYAGQSELERLCQIAAAELLFPLEPFVAATARASGGVQAVLSLSDLFGASSEATARRVVETIAEPMIGLIVRPIDVETSTWIEYETRGAHSPHAPLKVFASWTNELHQAETVAVGASAAIGGSAERAWKRASLAKSKVVVHTVLAEDWSHSGVHGVWISEAVTLPKGRRTPSEVLCLLRRPTSSTA